MAGAELAALLDRHGFDFFTGGQLSPSREVRLDRLALSAGYRTAVAVTTPDEVAAAVRSAGIRECAARDMPFRKIRNAVLDLRSHQRPARPTII